MLQFKRIRLSDAQWIEPLLSESGFRGSEYVFSNLYIYREIYQIDVAAHNGFVLVRTCKDDRTSYLFPAGGAVAHAPVELLEADARERGVPFAMHSVPRQGVEMLETCFPDSYVCTQARDSFDYIYEAQRLITLSGKKMHAKRNFINRFQAAHQDKWQFEPLSRENLDACWEMNLRWCAQSGCGEDPGKREEFCAVRNCFYDFEALKLQGGLLRLDGEVVAYSMGRPLCNDTFIIHVEKAFADIDGAYPMINQQFASYACARYQYINREDDVGQPGLRQAKLSYKPDLLLEKFSVERKGASDGK